MIGFPWSLYSHTIFLYCGEKWTQITKHLVLIKRRSKVQDKNLSCERALNFDQWKAFSENYKPMRVWSWLVYKFTENYCCPWLFSEFIQSQKRHPTSVDKIRILTQAHKNRRRRRGCSPPDFCKLLFSMNWKK